MSGKTMKSCKNDEKDIITNQDHIDIFPILR